MPVGLAFWVESAGELLRNTKLKKLGKYEIIEELGRGAMGVVYKAKDPFIGRLVAIKTITASLADKPELLERFYREAQAAGGLQHPNIVTIYDMGKENDTPYIAMEFLEGESLEAVIGRKDVLPVSQKLGYMVQVCRALDFAHRRGVVHRDIKPANIVITRDGTIKVVDFGIARVVDTSKTQTGVLMGTVGYMSPEQVRGEKVDGRSDIWSTGVMFYEFLADHRPFSGDNFATVMLSIITQEPRPLKEFYPDCPAELEALIKKFLRKDTSERYQTMEEVLLEMEPLWKRLQLSIVAELVSRSQELLQKHELAKARDVLRQVLLIDTAHAQAKTLLEKVNAELKREVVLPQLKEHVARGQALLQEGKFDEAKLEGEAALKLDSVFQPAQELLKQVQQESDRVKQINGWLQVSQQRMAEGSLTAADEQLDKILELYADHPQARALKKQLAGEMARRETRKHLQDSLQRARNSWTQQHYDDAVAILTELQKDFPNEAEVTKLLETVREDQGEQEKHGKLAEARSLLAAQKFEEAVKTLDALLKSYPGEPAAQKLRQHVIQEQKESERRQRFDRDHDLLKKLVTEEKYQEAITKGEQVLKEFPDDFDLARLVDFARTQHAQLEQKSRLQERTKELRELMDKGNYEQAIKSAEKALETFSGNVDLLKMLSEARTQQKEKEKREYVEKQIRSMKASIDTGNLTDAIELGRQTLLQVKHDTDVTRMLHFAEREHELREKDRAKDEQLKTAVFQMGSKKFDEAIQTLKDIEKTHVFDPTVQELLKAAIAKQPPPASALDKTMVAAPGGHLGPPAGVGAETQYVFHVPGGPAAAPPAEEATLKAQAASPAVEPSAVPKPPPPLPKPEVKPSVPPPVLKPEVKAPAAPPAKKKGKPEVEEVPVKAKPAVEAPPAKGKPAVEEVPAKAKPAVEVLPPPAPPKPRPAVEPPPAVQPPPPPVAKPAVAKPAVAVPAEVVAPPAKKTGLIAVVAIVVLLAAGGGYYFMSRSTGETPTTTTGPETTGGTATAVKTPEQQQRELMGQANDLADKEDFAGAITKIDEGLKLQGPLNSDLQRLRIQMQAGVKNREIWKQEKVLIDQGMAEFGQNKYDKAEATFKKVLAFKEGRRRADAQRYLSELIPARKQEEKNIAEAKGLANSTDPAKLQTAKGLLDSVVNAGGPRKSEAEDLRTKVQAKLDQLGKDALIAGSLSAGRDAIRREQYTVARQRADDIQAQGGDATALRNEINTAEQNRLRDLEGQVDRARQAKNIDTLQKLRGDFSRFAEASGNTTAKDFADNRIPAAIKDIEEAKAREDVASAARSEDEELSKAEAAYTRAVNAKDKPTLRGGVTAAFENIAQKGGRHAGTARDYISNKIPAVIASFFTCPPLPKAAVAAAGIGQTYKPGEIVPATQLASSLAWTQCSGPEFPAGKGTIMLKVTVDENGNVIEVAARAGQADPKVVAEVRKWKTTPPKWGKEGVAVKTSFALDLPYGT